MEKRKISVNKEIVRVHSLTEDTEWFPCYIRASIPSSQAITNPAKHESS